jgi:DNA-binding winged helix-turn-helix (wHTH) protein
MENSFTPPPNSALHIGDWTVNPVNGQIVRGQESVRLEARRLRLLLYLAERPGQVVSIDDLLTRVWPDVTVSPDTVYQAIASLRRQLGDDPRQPTYIATVPRLGYQMVASVSAPPVPTAEVAPESLSTQPESLAAPAPSPFRSRRKAIVPAAIVVALCLVLLAGFLIHSRAANKNSAAPSAIPVQPQKSIAVLPFLDLTQGMKEENSPTV